MLVRIILTLAGIVCILRSEMMITVELEVSCYMAPSFKVSESLNIVN